MLSYKSSGDIQEFTAPAAVTKDVGVKVGEALVIPLVTVANGVKFNGVLRGILDVAKVSAQAWTEGQQINWDDGAKLFTTVTTGNFLAGFAAAAAANPSATGKVNLSGRNLGAALV